MHRPSDMAESEWQREMPACTVTAAPEPPAEEISPDEETEEPVTRRIHTFDGPIELVGHETPLFLCAAREPDEDEGEEDDMDYLYDDEDEDLDDDLDEDLDEFEEEEEEFEDEDEEL
jgi:hypothetical protein